MINSTSCRTVMASSLEENLIRLSTDDQWQKIIDLEMCYPLEEKSKFLWAWPSVSTLKAIERILRANDVPTILSIGCGSGLLEWIVNRSTNIQVTGLELDRSWWSSNYSPQTFIDLQFTNCDITTEFLSKCANYSNKFALLFCYFNNRQAFLDYIRVFLGDIVIIIGPIEGSGIVTDPNPLNPQFDEDDGVKWHLIESLPMQTRNNCIAFYKKIHCLKC